ncbi:hypothetical protein RIF29_40086 [Crotalaria pallida]|uniref:Pre-mRNA-processing factor 39 n=1 Tax=Crotalaria pallida TaxID=3830 RepID=A0AAN9HN47_CROPI
MNPVPEEAGQAIAVESAAVEGGSKRTDANSDLQAQFGAEEENKEAVGHEAMETAQVSEYNSVVNGSVVGHENGNVENVSGSADAVMSAEEDRLWNIVRANSLDFTAWTALIEETEKVAEDNILKIRRVYDAFLAEFPLCYGYWKKYADHEARLGSVDKVVEVYERAVQGVTYSVDMWLHYCIFAISTYGDPETVRR